MHRISLIAAPKNCRSCGEMKSLREFHRHKRGLYGRDSICKTCSRAKTYSWRAQTPGGHAAIQRLYRQRHPDRIRAQFAAWSVAHPEYQRDRSRRRWRSDERPRLQQAHRRWNRANPDRVAAHKLNYARRRVGTVPTEYIVHLRRQPCSYCGGPGGTIDHVVPISCGGVHAVDNIAAACHSCNASKNSRTPAEWRAGATAARPMS